MNHIILTLTIVAKIATLLIGTFTTRTIAQSAYAYKEKVHDGDIIGNTINNQICVLNGIQNDGSNNSSIQECKPLTCIASGENVTCSQEQAAAVTPTTPVSPKPIPEPCPAGTVFDVTAIEDFLDSPPGTIICLTGITTSPFTIIEPDGDVSTFSGPVTISNPVGGDCRPQEAHVLVDSGNPPSPLHIGDIACALFT